MRKVIIIGIISCLPTPVQFRRKKDDMGYTGT